MRAQIDRQTERQTHTHTDTLIHKQLHRHRHAHTYIHMIHTYTHTVYVKSFVVYLISCFSWMTKIHEIFPLNKLQSTKLITLQETTTHLMNYQHCALHASRAYVLEDNRRYTIS